MMLIAWHTMTKTIGRSIDPRLFRDVATKPQSTFSVAPRGRPVEAVNQAHWPSPRPLFLAWESAPRPRGDASLVG